MSLPTLCLWGQEKQGLKIGDTVWRWFTGIWLLGWEEMAGGDGRGIQRWRRERNAVSQFRVCILQRSHLKANYVTMLHKGCPSSKAPPNAAHECTFFALFLEDALLLSFVASHIPRFFARPKKTQVKKLGNNRLFEAWRPTRNNK